MFKIISIFMKTPKPVFLILVLLVAGLIGVFVFFSNNIPTKNQKSPPITQLELSNDKQTKEANEKKSKGNDAAKLKDALKTGVFCQAENDNQLSAYYFKGNNVKLLSKEGSRQTNALVLNQKDIYYWEEGSNDGFKFTYQARSKDNRIEGQTSFMPGTMFNFSFEALDSTQSLTDFEKAISGQCRAEELADSLFQPPLNIRFSDFSAAN